MILEKYSASWVTDFANIKLALQKAILPTIPYTIEHIGSTAVPNLAAKPIIDVDIIYTINTDFDKIKLGLLQIGYYHNGNQGIENREVFKRDGKHNNSVLDAVPHHLYVCPIGCKALERHLLFRNFLVKNQWAMLQYQQMKYELAIKANQDKKLYAYLKEMHTNKFIDLIIEKEKSINTYM